MMEESKTRLSRAVDVVLRIPGLILLEMLYMESITLKNLLSSEKDDVDSLYLNVDIVLYILAWSLILLPQKSLLYLYSCAISCISMILSHYILRQLLVQNKILQSESNFDLASSSNLSMKDMRFLDIVLKEKQHVESSATVILMQLALVLFSCKIINARPKALILFSSPLYPWLACHCTPSTMSEIVAISYLLSFLAFLYHYVKLLNLTTIQWQLKVFWIKIQLIVRIFGWQGVVTWAQDEYQIQSLLVTCWLLRYTVQMIANFYHAVDITKFDEAIIRNLDINFVDMSDGLSLSLFFFFTGVQCLTTTINLFGLVCIVKDVVRLQYFLTRSWLHWSLHDHPPDSVTGPLTGFIDGITLLIMTLYTDALNTNVEGRMVLMIYILFTIASSQFQSMFNIVDPILMTLATAHNGTVWKHIRTVMFAVILLGVSGFLSYVSFFVMRSTFWVFIVAYNYINTFSLMLGSLSIYCILMVDYLTLRGWTSLDDVMFYIRGACRAVEFCVTLCMCGYIMMTFYSEMSSLAGMIMLAVYTYYCIVQRGGKGWRIWQMRRQAGNKVCSLPLASQEMLRERDDDLCPICYQAMESYVRIMHCNHLFHENCLKKWFYIQDKCPMCYAEFKPTSASDSSLKTQNNFDPPAHENVVDGYAND